MKLLKSKRGEVQTEEYWREWVNEFWVFAEKQNRYINNPRAKTNRREFKKPDDAFERVAKILGLEPVIEEPGYNGVF